MQVNQWLPKAVDPQRVQDLKQELALSANVPEETQDLYCQLLVQRDILSAKDAQDFFNPNLSQLHDPFLMKDMDLAVERLNKAIEQKQRILIYGDYDVDGTTSVSLLMLFLKPLAEYIEAYVPDRYKEGYGISKIGIEHAAKQNIDLIIALDCGITAHEQVDLANSLGMDCIICDHHLPKETLPKAIAILDPKRNDCPYPYKELCGCGVGFKFLQGYCIHNEIDLSSLTKLLDLVCIAVGCDIVPITGENRVLAHLGLEVLNTNPQIGVAALKKSTQYEEAYFVSDVVFKLGPRINAAGRLNHGLMAVRLLITSDSEEADKMATDLNTENLSRQSLDREITEDALGIINASEEEQKRYTTVLMKEGWHKGVIGIVASRLIESYFRPTIILTLKDGMATGSARSVRGFDIHKAIASCEDLLDNFGGHKYAAGLSMKAENFKAFKERFENYVLDNIDPELLIPKISFDTEISFPQINPSLYKTIQRFRPFGPGNSKPTFLSTEVELKEGTRLVGKSDPQIHLKMNMEQNGKRLNGIGFSLGPRYQALTSAQCSICFTLEENNWPPPQPGAPKRINLQLNVKDLKNQ